MSDVSSLLTDQFFRSIGIPLIAIFLTTLLKLTGRKDTALSITKTDLDIGNNLMVAAIVVILNYSIKVASDAKAAKGTENYAEELEKVINLLFLMFFLFIVSIILSVIIRRWGWDPEDDKRPHMIWGVYLPLIIGFFSLMVAVNYANS